MVVGSDQVYGRKPAIRIVRELMAREEVDGSLRNQRFPILVVEGFRGAGKTALLSALEELLDERVPYARLDLEANKHALVPEILSALARTQVMAALERRWVDTLRKVLVETAGEVLKPTGLPLEPLSMHVRARGLSG